MNLSIIKTFLRLLSFFFHIFWAFSVRIWVIKIFSVPQPFGVHNIDQAEKEKIPHLGIDVGKDFFNRHLLRAFHQDY